MSAAERPPIVFLDVDGVLLSTSTWDLPTNVSLLAEEAGRMMSIWEFSYRATFDPVAVALVNRLCRVTGARIVISSSWRASFGVLETRSKLVAEGIADEHFHADYACPLGRPLDKVRDVRAWLTDHGYDASQAARTWVALDDDVLGGINQVTTDPVAGFGVHEYRLACAWLGDLDKDYGVIPVAPDDMARVLEVFAGDVLAALEWLHARRNKRTRAVSLSPGSWYRYSDDYIEARRAEVWGELPGAAR